MHGVEACTPSGGEGTTNETFSTSQTTAARRHLSSQQPFTAGIWDEYEKQRPNRLKASWQRSSSIQQLRPLNATFISALFISAPQGRQLTSSTPNKKKQQIRNKQVWLEMIQLLVAHSAVTEGCAHLQSGVLLWVIIQDTTGPARLPGSNTHQIQVRKSKSPGGGVAPQVLDSSRGTPGEWRTQTVQEDSSRPRPQTYPAIQYHPNQDASSRHPRLHSVHCVDHTKHTQAGPNVLKTHTFSCIYSHEDSVGHKPCTALAAILGWITNSIGSSGKQLCYHRSCSSGHKQTQFGRFDLKCPAESSSDKHVGFGGSEDFFLPEFK